MGLQKKYYLFFWFEDPRFFLFILNLISSILTLFFVIFFFFVYVCLMKVLCFETFVLLGQDICYIHFVRFSRRCINMSLFFYAILIQFNYVLCFPFCFVPM